MTLLERKYWSHFQTTFLKKNFTIDIYVDAGFASGWSIKQGTNPDSVKSRTSYIVEVMVCPIIWCSKL